MSSFLIIPKLKVHNANALSSPFTIGFPAMTAWLGAVHALQRKLNQQSVQAEFQGVGVVCHKCDLQTYQGMDDFVQSIVIAANPLVPKRKRKKGEPWEQFERPSFIEEARCHLLVSMVIEIPEMSGAAQKAITENIEAHLSGRMKIAGGDIMGFDTPYISNNFDDFRNKLMPGYAIVERRDLMEQAMAEGQDALDAMLSFLTVSNTCIQDENGKVTWQRKRKQKGWFVPIATGFQGISPLGIAKNQRDQDTPHRFAESLVTLGEFKMPYRMNDAYEFLWYYQADLDNCNYLCQQIED